MNKNGRLISLHPRKAHNFDQAAVLAELFPKEFKHVTSIYFGRDFIKGLKQIAPRYARALGKRSHANLSKKHVITLPSTEIKRAWWEKKRKELHLIDYMNLNEYWQHEVLKKFAPPEICISYDGISHLIFRKWKNKSRLILDLAIAIPQYRLKVIHGDNFKLDMLTEVDDVQKRLFAEYAEELELADLILCGSEFVKQSVAYLFPDFESKCRILPYGVDVDAYDYPERKFVQTENLKFVFVGRVSLRKGATFLLDAWREFLVTHPTCELHFFGVADAEIDIHHLPENVFMHGWIQKHVLIDHLKQMDIFVFPTTFEGSSIAVYQAMALKLPVITTFNSGTVLKHGESCELVEVGNKNGLITAMNKLANDVGYREHIAQNAYLLSKDYTWEDYKVRLAKIIEEVKTF